MHLLKRVTTGLPPWRLIRQVLPLGVGGVCIWLFFQQIDPGMLQNVPAGLAGVSPLQWSLAVLATALSFWALGRYDLVFHRFFETGFTERAVVISGASAIAVAQVLGLGVITGALARWRILPGLSVALASKIALSVAVSFLACLACLVAVAGLVWGAGHVPVWVCVVLIISIIICVIAAIVHPALIVRSYRVSMPSLPAFMRLLGLSAIDTAAADTALYILMPPDLALVWSQIYVVYLLALSAALLTGTPGGVGPFELTLLACLPHVPEPEILTSILAFRLVYYALPALCALPALGFPQPAGSAPDHLSPIGLSERDISMSRRAEMGTCRQNQARRVTLGATSLAILHTGQTTTALLDPLGPVTPALFQEFARHARAQDRWPMIYKCTGRTAAKARHAGWHACRIANEAVLNPCHYTVQGPECRQLRRKLRQATKSGVEVRRAQHLPLAELRRIDAEWQQANGGARGLSMGQFSGPYLAAQQVYIAWQDTEILGFVSFHRNAHEMCLDLMRTCKSAPAGTMHLLVHTAIEDAARRGVCRVSLAAMPCQAHKGETLWQRGLRSVHSDGLRQFKTSFAVQAEPLYAVAPHRAALALGLLDLALCIRGSQVSGLQHLHEQNTIARPCQT